MGIFDKISKICNEEKKRAIRAHEQSKIQVEEVKLKIHIITS